PNTDAFQGQDTIQVRRAESTWREVRRLAGKRVVVKGTLAEWALGPDRTPVVIDPTEGHSVPDNAWHGSEALSKQHPEDSVQPQAASPLGDRVATALRGFGPL